MHVELDASPSNTICAFDRILMGLCIARFPSVCFRSVFLRCNKLDFSTAWSNALRGIRSMLNVPSVLLDCYHRVARCLMQSCHSFVVTSVGKTGELRVTPLAFEHFQHSLPSV